MCCEKPKPYYIVRRVEGDMYEYLCHHYTFFESKRFWSSDPDAAKDRFSSVVRAKEVAFAMSASIKAEFEVIKVTPED